MLGESTTSPSFFVPAILERRTNEPTTAPPHSDKGEQG